MMNRFYLNDSTFAIYYTHSHTLSNVCRFVSNSFPDVTINLDTAKTASLDRFNHYSLTPQQGIGIAYALVLTRVKKAFGKWTDIEKSK